MRVLYDYQAFAAQRAGGVSRYFVELMREWGRTDGIRAGLLAPLSVNLHLAEARAAGVPGIRGVGIPSACGPSRALSLADRLLFWAGTLGRAWDVYHPTYYNALRPCSHIRKKVATVFDMAHERHPELFAAGDPTARRKRRLLEEADGIVCISESTRRELERFLGPPRVPVAVIPLATRIGETAAAPFAHPRPYWLFVGTRGGYKDFTVLLEALARSDALGDTGLVCFGGGPFSPDERAALSGLGLAGRVCQRSGGDALLRGAYESALALVYPSRYEGFGLPPLEAMTVGCPVVAADAASLPEVVGDAGERIPPGRPDALAAVLEGLRGDETRRAALKAAGLRRAALFSWAATAARTRAFYHNVLASPGHVGESVA